MSDFVTLIGADDVRSAGNAMKEAAESIRQSIGHFEEALRFDRVARDEQLEYLRTILDNDRAGRAQ